MPTVNPGSAGCPVCGGPLPSGWHFCSTECGAYWSETGGHLGPLDHTPDDAPTVAAPTGGEDRICDVCEAPFHLALRKRRKTRYYLCGPKCAEAWLKDHKPLVVRCRACNFVFFLSEQTPDTDLCAECRNPDKLIVRPCAYCEQPFSQPRGPKRYQRKYCTDDHERLAQVARVRQARAKTKALRTPTTKAPHPPARPRPVSDCAECGQPRPPTTNRGPLPVYCGANCRQKAFRRRQGFVTSNETESELR